MPFNATNTTASGNSSVPNASDFTPQNHASASTPQGGASAGIALGQGTAENFWLGVGKGLRDKWDYLNKRFWGTTSSPSPEEIAQRQEAIYVAGLKECIQHLKSALENVRKNPNDPASLGKIDELAQHYTAYVNFAPTMELNLYQQQFFQPIMEEVKRLPDRNLKRKLKMLLPVLSIDIPVQEHRKMDSSGQDEEYSIALSQSYYDEGNAFKKTSESSSSEKKRSIEQTQFPAVFDLSTLNGSNGFSVPGIVSTGYLGISAGCADLNGDGFDDSVVAAWNTNSKTGIAYVIFGSSRGFSAQFDLSTLNGSNGFSIPGVAIGGSLGNTLSSAGDVNGDNVTDLVLGAFLANSAYGASYVIFGNRSGFPAVFNLSTLNGSNGFSVAGIASGGYLGTALGSCDLNGDNVSDLALGAFLANSGNGIVYVIFGRSSGFPAQFNLSTLNGTNGFSVPGIVVSGALGTNSCADVNGDGVPDLVLGAYNSGYMGLLM